MGPQDSSGEQSPVVEPLMGEEEILSEKNGVACEGELRKEEIQVVKEHEEDVADVAVEADEILMGVGRLDRRNSEIDSGNMNGRMSRCTADTQSLKSDSDMDLSSDENNRQLQMKIIIFESRIAELSSSLAEEKERRVCDVTHFQKDREDLFGRIDYLMKEVERLKKDKESAVMKYAKSEHEAITSSKARDLAERRLKEVTHDRDAYVGRVRQLNQDYSRLQGRLEGRALDLNKLEKQIDKMRDEKLMAQQKLQDLERYCDKLLAEQHKELMKTASEQARELSVKLDETQSRLNSCQQERDVLYEKVLQLEDTNRHLLEHIRISESEIERLKTALNQVEDDHSTCSNREAESLRFTQQLTETTVRTQSENESLKAKVVLISSDLTRLIDKSSALEKDLEDLKTKSRSSSDENKCFQIRVSELERERDSNQRRLREVEHEKVMVRKKCEQNTKHLSKELQIARSKLDELQPSKDKCVNENHTTPGFVNTDIPIDPRLLIERISKLQRTLAKKTEKIEFLEEHVRELTAELNRKPR